MKDDEATIEEASLIPAQATSLPAISKIINFEKRISGLRLLVILMSAGCYLLSGGDSTIAFYIIAIALFYTALIVFLKNYRSTFPVILFILGDLALVMLWLWVTGGYGSPYFPVIFISIAGIAFSRTGILTVLPGVLYALCYAVVVLFMDGFLKHEFVVLLQCAYIILSGYLAGLMANGDYYVAREKWLIRELVEKIAATEEQLNAATKDLADVYRTMQDKIDEHVMHLQNVSGNFEQIVESVPLAIWKADSNGKIIFANRWLRDFFGARTIDSPDGITEHEDRERSLAKMQEAAEYKHPYRGECRWLQQDGLWVWMLVSAAPVYDKAGALLMWMGAAVDINSQRQLIDQKATFTRIAAQEMKEPFEGVKNYTGLVANALAEDEYEAAKIFIRKAGIYLGAMQEVIAGLMDTSRVQEGRVEYNMQQFNLGALVRETIDSLRELNKSTRINIVQDESLMICGDRKYLQQVLNILLSAVIHYNKGVTEIVVETKQQKNNVLLRITDPGLTIPADQFNIIFTPSQALTNPDVPVKSFGPLFVAREIVHSHKGDIYAENRAGKGFTLQVTLPLAQPPNLY